MSISPQEQETLDLIEKDLASSGPKLASMLATFARLTAGEDIPVRERIRRTASVPSAARAPDGAGPSAGQASARPTPPWCRARVLWRWLWLVLTFAVMAALLAFDHGGGKGICTVARTAACAQIAGYANAPAPSSAGRPSSSAGRPSWPADWASVTRGVPGHKSDPAG